MPTRVYTIDDVRSAVRKARREAGYTQMRLAALTGATRKWLSDFERGRGDPPLSLAINLLVTLGIGVTLADRPPAEPGTEDGFAEIDGGI